MSYVRCGLLANRPSVTGGAYVVRTRTDYGPEKQCIPPYMFYTSFLVLIAEVIVGPRYSAGMPQSTIPARGSGNRHYSAHYHTDGRVNYICTKRFHRHNIYSGNRHGNRHCRGAITTIITTALQYFPRYVMVWKPAVRTIRL